MKEEEIKNVFEEAKAIITGSHFVYAKKADGWYHGPDYVNKDAIYPYPRRLAPLCKEMGDRFGRKFEVVVGPTVGGVSLSQWTAFYSAPFGDQKEVLAIFADEEDVIELYQTKAGSLASFVNNCVFHANGMVRISADSKNEIVVNYECKVATRRVLKRGYEQLVREKKCLVVEDIVLSGLTVIKTIQAIQKAGGKVIGVASLCDRSGGKVTAATLGVPKYESLLKLRMKTYRESKCPLCEKYGVESVRTDLGKGKEFLFRIGKPMKS
jgi:orotate phosphoribosyltransferase